MDLHESPKIDDTKFKYQIDVLDARKSVIENEIKEAWGSGEDKGGRDKDRDQDPEVLH